MCFTGSDFETLVQPYVLSALARGIPSLFTDLKSLYVDEHKCLFIGAFVTRVTQDMASSEISPRNERRTLMYPVRLNRSFGISLGNVLSGASSVPYVTNGSVIRFVHYRIRYEAHSQHAGTVHCKSSHIEACWRQHWCRSSDGRCSGPRPSRSMVKYEKCKVPVPRRPNRSSECSTRAFHQSLTCAFLTFKFLTLPLEGCFFTRSRFGRYAIAILYARRRLILPMYRPTIPCSQTLLRSYQGEGRYLLHERANAPEQTFQDFEDDQFDFHSYCLRKQTINSYTE
jgi:hypothetical protein